MNSNSIRSISFSKDNSHLQTLLENHLHRMEWRGRGNWKKEEWFIYPCG